MLDCQGLREQDNNVDTIDAIVTVCGLEMSKLHLLNFKGDLDASDLRHLEVKGSLTTLGWCYFSKQRIIIGRVMLRVPSTSWNRYAMPQNNLEENMI